MYPSCVFLAFRDANGERGTISEDLSVNYDGEWKREVERVISEVTAPYRNDDETEPDAVFTELVVELPANSPVRSVERRDE